jgi:hypothetical protein
MAKYGKMATVSMAGVSGRIIQPVADLKAQIADCHGRFMGDIGDKFHLWNDGFPQTVVNRRHGDHTPWSADGSGGWIYAIDVGPLPRLPPHEFLTEFLVPCVRKGLYPEYKYGISGFELYDRRPQFGMRRQKGTDGFDHCHLSFMPNARYRHSRIVWDAVLWQSHGRPDPVDFVRTIHNPLHREDFMNFFSKAMTTRIKGAVILAETERDWRKRQQQVETEVAGLKARIAALEKTDAPTPPVNA